MKRAHEISADDVVTVPAQRIDTLVTDPSSGQQRHRTDYAGTVWYGGLPQIIAGHPLPGRNADIEAPFWLPDSHRYEPGAAGEIQIQAVAAIQGSRATSAGGNFTILEVAAALGEDPENSGAVLLYLAIKAIATLPLGVAYRAVVIAAPEAVRPPAA